MPGPSAQKTASSVARGPGLKDPLQTEQTAYEILELDRAASDADVQKAFAMGLARRVNVQKLTSAKKILQSPVDRAVLDFFRYCPDWAERVSPNPIHQPLVLDPARRASTAATWEQQLKSAFPDPGVAHNLALVWYWSALHEEQTAHNTQKTGQEISKRDDVFFAQPAPAPMLPVLNEMWQKAIAAWSMVLSNEDAWVQTLGISNDIASQVSSAVISRLNNHFHEFAQKYRSNNSSSVATQYQELELALATEIRTAKQIATAGIRTGRGKIVCGALMLKQVGLLQPVRDQVEASLKRSPSSENLAKLQSALSPYGSVLILIDNKRPQAAIEALNALPVAEQKTPAVRSIRIEALNALAQQCVSLNDVDDALTHWEEAIRLEPDAETRLLISSGVASGCQSRVAQLQNHEPDAAITLLERGLKCADDEKLSLLLAELLTNRGIRVINAAQKSAEQNPSSGIAVVEREIKKGLADLDRAAALGSKRAVQQAEIARQMCEELVFSSVLREAHQAAEREDWDTAIRLLRKAVPSASGETAVNVKKNLAVCLGNRAMKSANSALQRPNPTITKRNELFAQISLASSFDSGCALCYSTYGESWYSVNLPDGGTARICGDCATTVQKVLADASKPDPTTLAQLRSAEKDLADAVDLDSSNQHVRKNLQDLRSISAQVERGASFGPPVSSRARVSTPKKKFKFWSSLGRNLGKVMSNPLSEFGWLAVFSASAGGIWEWIGLVLFFCWLFFSIWLLVSLMRDDYMQS